MCKIFLVAGIKPTTVNKVWKFTEAIAKPMSRGNSDGLGYAGITAEGKLFGERWLVNDHAFKSKLENDETEINYEGAIENKKEQYEYTSFGDVNKESVIALTMHTRWATSPRGMINVHPFVLDDVSLIHNGVIRNHDEFKLKSTCDSEAILQAYVEHKVWESPDRFQSAADMLRGYYACGVLVNTNAGPFMDIFKAYTAMLYVAYVKQLETWVHCTSESDIKDVCKELGYDIGHMYSILPSKFIRVNAITGKKISVIGFNANFEYASTFNERNFTPSRTSNHNGYSTTPHTETKLTKLLQSRKTLDNVLPYGKKKETTKVSDDLLAYFKSGIQSCVKLTDREIQEEIMNTERTLGRY